MTVSKKCIQDKQAFMKKKRKLKHLNWSLEQKEREKETARIHMQDKPSKMTANKRSRKNGNEKIGILSISRGNVRLQEIA